MIATVEDSGQPTRTEIFSTYTSTPGQEIPSSADNGEFLFQIWCAIFMDPDKDIEVTIDSELFVSVEDFEEAINDLDNTKAPLASPAFTGIPTAPTATTATSTTQLATTAFVHSAISSATTSLAPLASPTFTGTPTAPTVDSTSDNSTKIATTAFVHSAIQALSPDKVFIITPDKTSADAAAQLSAAQTANKAIFCEYINGAKKWYYLLVHYESNIYTFASANHDTNGNRVIGYTATVASGNTGITWESFDHAVAPIASPVFTGAPKSVTPASADNSTKIATTAYVQTAISGKANAATSLSGYGITDAYISDKKVTLGSNTAIIDAYPLATSTSSIVWNTEYRLGAISSATAIALPAPPTDRSSEIRFIFECETDDIGLSFTEPSGYDLYGTENLEYVAGNVYEISVATTSSTDLSLLVNSYVLETS